MAVIAVFGVDTAYLQDDIQDLLMWVDSDSYWIFFVCFFFGNDQVLRVEKGTRHLRPKTFHTTVLGEGLGVD
ncbi:MAG: hypothetical protein Q8S21_02560 [Candidatus Paracaedibacteraceae bacterium]|nr:hypothetical protein [Candidatus Paracaedibacteraceae bacterium]